MTDVEILTTTRAWSAMPWDYNRLIFLRFRANGSGDMSFACFQSVQARIDFCFTIGELGALEFTYVHSAGKPPYIPSFNPDADQASKMTRYSLKNDKFTGRQNVPVPGNHAGIFVCNWMLQLDDSPFPDKLKLRALSRLGYSPSPLCTYYGHCEYKDWRAHADLATS